MRLPSLINPKKNQSVSLLKLSPYELIPNPMQPRSSFDDAQLQSLADSIARHGILQPICVKKREHVPVLEINGQRISDPQRYEIIAGERRWRAAKLLALKEVPCILMEADGGKSATIALEENINREELNFFEQATALQNIMLVCSLTQSELAKRLGLNQSTVANKLRLLKLTEEERKIVLQNKLSERHARALVRIDDPRQRLKMLRLIELYGFSAEECEKRIESYLKGTSCSSEKNKRPERRFIGTVSDVKFFINTVDKAVNLAAAAGFQVEREELDDGEFIELRLKIPKSRS